MRRFMSISLACVCVLVCVLLMMVYRMSTTAQAQEVPGNRMAQGPEQQRNATQHNVTERGCQQLPPLPSLSPFLNLVRQLLTRTVLIIDMRRNFRRAYNFTLAPPHCGQRKKGTAKQQRKGKRDSRIKRQRERGIVEWRERRRRMPVSVRQRQEGLMSRGKSVGRCQFRFH